ncbi:Phosphate permease PHO89 [Smittium culicis]|uniref:Phosphate transporter n=1 Tax=Smittium culicis TaxID=133412 RepID=A0A1R1Y286_9FUNG|nr:Phosphate permease PHO89 [Smittium culicis]
MEEHKYSFIFFMALIFSFADAYGMGANDVANSFATSVASGTLSLKQAVCIAVFTEFIGAFFLGSKTSQTIRGGIIDISRFDHQPELLMLGMTTSALGSASWVIFATSRGWPVSSTHSIIGAIIGMRISAFGENAIKWGFNGFLKIIASWLISPVVAAIVSAFIYILTKYIVFEHENSFERGLRAIPVYIFFTLWINLAFIISTGKFGPKLTEFNIWKIAGISGSVSFIMAILSYFFYSSWLKRKIIDKQDMKLYQIFLTPFLGPQPIVIEPTESEVALMNEKSDVKNLEKGRLYSFFKKVEKSFFRGIKKDVVGIENPNMRNIRSRAKKYDCQTEHLFQFIQVFTACAASFSHGSNDVSNVVGPLSTVYHVWSSAKIPNSTNKLSLWCLAYCAIAIDIGFATYGYNVVRTLGNNITFITPSRGFAAELGTSLIVVTASRFGIPVSTTHCISGAMVGVGLCNGSFKAINWRMFAICFLSWVITLPVAGLISGLLFTAIAYSPEKRHRHFEGHTASIISSPTQF